ncbi:MAG: PAS/PAC sensor signal transduction histidine kinase [Parcubacteria group bacterium GW2011_GWE2_39_37]|uniref:histidine kinase n=1 Tax=Candidatus Falkowbacteria bacterium GW2011_GWF2_39_8 TaxID=1618642 RepID=A0A0G0Q579_9BACT|nr:MAG: PAS/PAC sensor signal transduction histidine kinase [Parcubacteria group bacterium GW2011_GWE2_39_37]KKR32526.1 MAG: PAS/PAC sensor signal transduction histidine kinase [Candidatus Falkowbacteria bacterium GW2011_GWF2_39_8]
MQKAKRIYFPGINLRDKIMYEIKDLLFEAPLRKEFWVMTVYSIILFSIVLILAAQGYFQKSTEVIVLSFAVLGIYFLFSDLLKRKQILPPKIQFTIDSLLYVFFMMIVIINTGGHYSPIKYPLVFLTAISAPLYGGLFLTAIFLIFVLGALIALCLYEHSIHSVELLLLLLQGISLFTAGLIINISKNLYENKEASLNDKVRELKISENKISYYSKKLGAEKKRIETVLENIADGVFVINNLNKIIIFNRMANNLTGYSASEVLDKNYKTFLKFEDGEGKLCYRFIEDTLKHGKSNEYGNCDLLIKKDGSKLPVEKSAAPLVDSNGETIGCIVAFRDVTAAREVDKMKSEFVSLATHQLKTPLTTIKLFSDELLHSKNDKEKKSLYLERINISVNRMIKLIDDLLNISRLESGKIKPEPETCDLIELVNNSVENCIALANEHRIKIIFKPFVAKRLNINADPTLVSQVIQNMLTNAIKYSGKGKQVVMKIAKEKDNYVLSVKDNGIGIATKDTSKLFSKFFRTEAANQLTNDGTGLGLYLAKMITEASGGKIWFETKENKGTTFYLSLPVKK